MPEEKKSDATPKSSGSVSRRSFLKDAGIAVGAPALASIPGIPGQAAAAEPAAGPPPAEPPVCTTIQVEAQKTVELTVNGGKYRLAVEPHWSLRQLLRDTIGLTSPKDWCGGLGACGSCTVIVNGRPVLSCLTLACECGGAAVETAEGIAKSGHPIIQAYIDNNAFQCGYCTPGFVMTAKGFLAENPDPTAQQIREGLSNNLCRCGCYQAIVQAVLRAAAVMRGAVAGECRPAMPGGAPASSEGRGQ